MQEGFRYHHAEADYLMLVRWLPDTPDTLPVNASHRVGIGAFILNKKRQVFISFNFNFFFPILLNQSLPITKELISCSNE